MNHYVMDYETMSDCFVAVFEHYKTDEIHIFTISKISNDFDELLKFLHNNMNNKEIHISYNGLHFDSQITQFILNNASNWKTRNLTAVNIAKLLYKEAQEIIERSNQNEFQKYSEKDLHIKQIDVFKINHWDSPAKRASLKWIQCSMDWFNIEEMPFTHTQSITTKEELSSITNYCINDVKSTKEIMRRSKNEILLRNELSKSYNLLLQNASEPKIGRELFLKFLSAKTFTPVYDLRQLRTFRQNVIVNDILLPYIKFDNDQFKELHRNFKNLVINPNVTRNGFKYMVEHKGIKIKFGLGGVHGAKKGVFKSDESFVIMSSDVVSYYPNLAIKNKMSPAHINKEDFCEQYKWFFDQRILIPKSNSKNYIYKIILNSVFGLSNDKHSPFYDPSLFLEITVNGQLSLMMLYNMILDNIPGSVPVMQNTDGIETIIPRKYKQQYMDICSEWETITKLQLEHDEYDKLVVPDVNTYLGIHKEKQVTREEWIAMQKNEPYSVFTRNNGKYFTKNVKTRGRFEIIKPLHKDKSFSIITKALFNYFVHDINPEVTVKKSKNIFDFCGQTRVRGEWDFMYLHIDNEQNIKRTPVQRTIRYYISKKGGKIIKKNRYDKREINVVAGKNLQILFNTYVEKPFSEYNIDYSFYLKRIKQEIEGLEPPSSNQMELNF